MFLKLKTLKIKAFRRFAKEQVIDFTQREKIFQIDGIRSETGGSSGSGKSSIIMAIDYLFGVSDISDGKLQSWLTKDSIEVSATFDAEDLGGTKSLTITRGKKTGLIIDIDGEVTSGSSKLSEEKLDEIIGIPRPLFRRMYHKKQKEGGFFINLTGSQSYKTLIDILGLKSYTDKIETIDQRIKDEKLDLTVKEGKLANMLSSLEEYNSLITNLKMPEPFIAKDMKEVDLELEMTKESLETLRTQKTKQIESVESPILKELGSIDEELQNNIVSLTLETQALTVLKLGYIDKKKSEIEKILKAKKTKETELNSLNSLKIEHKNISEKEDKLNKELSHIVKSECPTCLQAWIANSAKEAIVKINAQIFTHLDRKSIINEELQKENGILDTISKLEALYKTTEAKDVTSEVDLQIADYKGKIAILNEKKQSIVREIENSNNLAKNEYNAKLNEITQKFYEACRLLDNRISNLNVEKTTNKALLDNYNKSIKDWESNYQVIASQTLQTQNKYKLLEKEIDNIRKSVNIGSEAKRAIKSYTMNIFQESLDAIGEQATRILNTTPNMATASIYFESAKENKDGKVKEEINGVLSCDGEEAVDIVCLSGGEKTSVELAVDLAFLNMVENKVKIGCDFFLLDEPMQGLDFVNAAPIIEMLRELDGNKRIAIIEHNQEIKEIIDDKIVVERIGTESNILG